MRTRIFILASVFALCGGMLFAQEHETLPVHLGSYGFSGNLTGGYRATSVSGLDGRTSDLWAERMFNELYNLNSSPIFELNLYGQKPIGGEGLFDQMFLNASHTGPYTTGSLRARTFGSYDLRIDFRHSDYQFNRFDSIFSDNRNFDMTRNRLNASLSVTPIDILDIGIKYSGTGHDQTQTIPRAPFLELPSAIPQWGGYNRANLYAFNTPRNDWRSEFSGYVTAKLPMTTVTAGAGYRKFTQDINPTPVNSVSLNYLPNDSTVNENGIFGTNKVDEPLTSYLWDEKRETKGPFYFGEVIFKPINLISVTAAVRAEDQTGTNTIVGSQAGTIRNNSSGTKLQFYQASINGTNEFTIEQLQASVAVSVRPVSGLQIVGGFDYLNTDRTGLGEYHFTIDTAAVGAPAGEFTRGATDSIQALDPSVSYNLPTTTVFGQIFYAPLANLSMRAGARMSTRKPVARFIEDGHSDSVFATNLSKETQFTTLTFNVNYRPIRALQLRARVESKSGVTYLEGTTTETDFTPRRTPKNDLGISGSVDVDLMEGLGLSVNMATNSGKTSLTMPDVTNPEFEHTNQMLGAAISYDLDENTHVMVSGNYQQRDLDIPATFARGTLIGIPPLGNSKTDSLTVIVGEHTIDRFLAVSASTKPIDVLTVGVGFDYIRSTGGTSMTASIPDATKPGDVTRVGGPYTLWQTRGHVRYDFLEHLGVAVDAVWASHEEDQTDFFVALNNFKSSMITFSLIVQL